MARSPSGRPSSARGPWNNTDVQRGPAGLRASDRYQDCPWPRLFSDAELREFDLTRDDADAIDQLAEVVFRLDISEEEAVLAFDRAFGWCVDEDERKAVAS